MTLSTKSDGLKISGAEWNELIRVPNTYVHVDSFAGVDPTGSTSSSIGILAAIAALSAQGGIIAFGPGVYLIDAELLINARTDIEFRGAGNNATRLQVNGDVNVFRFTGVCSRIKIRDMWVGSLAVRTSGYGLRIEGDVTNNSDNFLLQNVTFQNLPHALWVDKTQLSRFDNIRVVQSVAGACSGTQIYFYRSIGVHFTNFFFLAAAGTFGNDGIELDSDCDTINLRGGDVLNCTGAGIWMHNSLGVGHTGPRLVRVTDVHNEFCGVDGFLIDAGRDIRLTGCESAANTGKGFSITGGSSITLIGCLAVLNQLHGYYVTGGTAVSLSACNASDNGQVGTNTYDGIYILANGTRIEGCRSGDFIYGTGPRQRYGLTLSGVTKCCVIGNDLTLNMTDALTNAGTPADILTNIIRGNIGVNDVPIVSTANLPAAGAAQDGIIILEDAGAGDRNLIIYAGGQRFRIDGGAAF